MAYDLLVYLYDRVLDSVTFGTLKKKCDHVGFIPECKEVSTLKNLFERREAHERGDCNYV